MRPILQIFIFHLVLLTSYVATQRSALIHPAHPFVNSQAYLNATGDVFILKSPIGQCQFRGGPVPCDCFTVEGEYRLIKGEEELLRIPVSPPQISLSLPASLPLLHSLVVDVLPKLCTPKIHDVQLWHRSLEILPDSEDPWTLAGSSRVVLKDAKTSITFPCETTSRSGLYAVHVVGPHGVTVKSSQHTLVNSSTEVSIKGRSDSIYPHCSDEYTVQWTLPSCHTLSHLFRLRIFSVPEGNSNHIEERSIYVEEIELDHGQTSISFSCSQFDIIYEKYCFELVSLDKNSSQFHMWDTKCVNTEPIVSVDGGWSHWSSWSSCTGHCGTGVRTRTRTCDNPRPNRGKDCVGDVLEREECSLEPCKVSESFRTPSNCTCGCELRGENGSFFASYSMNRKKRKRNEKKTGCNGNITWWLHSHREHVVDVVIVEKGRGQRMMVYQGEPYTKLLWRSDGTEQSSFTLQLSLRLYFVVYEEKLDVGQENGDGGFTVVYSVRRESSSLAVTRTDDCGLVCPQTAIIAVLSFVFLSLILVPPFVCAKLTRSFAGRNCTPDVPLMEKRPDSEMIRSGNTESTQISTKYIAKRSIGIQLSVHSTPRVGRASETPLHNGSSTVSVLDELEYDDYDGTHEPGSLLAPPLLPGYSTIDIDQIIAEARKVIDYVDTSDAHTQINH